MGDAYGKLYDLFWRRAVASQMTDALIESTTVYVDTAVIFADQAKQTHKESEGIAKGTSGNNSFRLKATGSVLLFEGFLKLTPQALEDIRLPKFTTGESLPLAAVRTVAHETTPPPRYNDAS